MYIASPKHPLAKLRLERPFGIGRVFGRISAIQVLTPFVDIAVHVVKPPRIWLTLCYFLSLSDRATIKPSLSKFS